MALLGRVNGPGGRIQQITSTSVRKSLKFATIMKTIRDEVNAGALTTKGQASARREELVERYRREAAAGMAEATARGEAIISHNKAVLEAGQRIAKLYEKAIMNGQAISLPDL